MEIERKYLIHKLPENLDTYPYKKIEQAYLCTEPVAVSYTHLTLPTICSV